MKYEFSCRLRFDTEKERDALFDLVQKQLSQKFMSDDAFIQKLTCFHDKSENEPCTNVIRITALEVAPIIILSDVSASDVAGGISDVLPN